jgi:hypothetical protein
MVECTPKRAYMGAISLFYYCSYLNDPYLIYRASYRSLKNLFSSVNSFSCISRSACFFSAIKAFNNKYAISCWPVGEAIAAFQTATLTAVRIPEQQQGKRTLAPAWANTSQPPSSIITSSSYPCHPFYHAFPSFPF